MKVTKAVIMAAGKGTRFLPYTKAYPKEMLAVIDKPALQLIVEEVVDAGITDIMIVISPEKDAVKSHFAKDTELVAQLKEQGKTTEAESVAKLNSLANISYAYQPVVTGTAMALKLAEEFADGQAVAVLNGDDVIFNKGKTVTRQLVEAYEHSNKSVIGVQEVERSQVGKYASCKVVSSKGRLHIISDIIEKPKSDSEIYSLLAPLGRYVVSPDIFSVIDSTPYRGGKEVYLTDSLQIQARTSNIFAYEFEGKRYDFGDKFGYLVGVTEYALRDKNLGAAYAEYLKQLVATLK